MKKQLTKTELLALEKYINELDKQVGLKFETLREIQYKIVLEFKNAPE